MGFSLDLERAERRLGREAERRTRSDRGISRLPAEVLALARQRLLGQDKPELGAVAHELRTICAARGWRAPSRTTLYNLMRQVEGHLYPIAKLPIAVQAVLHNLDQRAEVPGHQLVFHCINYGDTSCVSFASGLAWLDLYQALEMPGFRAKSHGLLLAVCRARGIA